MEELSSIEELSSGKEESDVSPALEAVLFDASEEVELDVLSFELELLWLSLEGSLLEEGELEEEGLPPHPARLSESNKAENKVHLRFMHSPFR